MRTFSNCYVALGAMIPFAIAAVSNAGVPTNTSFTYQGQLKQGGVPVNAMCDFEVSLWGGDNDPDPGTQLASTIPLTAEVANGLFQFALDFGAAAFNGDARWLQIDVCCASPCSPAFVTLTPRQAISVSPYANHTRGLFVDDVGRVGIGTDTPSPETTLHVQADADNFGVLVDSLGVVGSEIGLHSGPSGYAGLAKNAFFAPGWTRFDESKGAFLQEVDPGGGVRFQVSPPDTGFINWKTSLFMNANGNVGVGSNSTDFPFHVKKAHPGDWIAGIHNVGTGPTDKGLVVRADGGDPLLVQSSSANLLSVLQNGNVGIGTTSPSAKLHIDNTDGQPGILVENDWYAIRGTHVTTTGTFPGVWGDTNSRSSGASGVRGIVNDAVPGADSSGLYGINNGTGTAGNGVRGWHQGSGIGVKGEVTNSDGYAGYFQGGRNYFQGDVGIGTTTPNFPLHVETTGQLYGVFVDNARTNGVGVFGSVSSSSGSGSGVSGGSESTSGRGVSGFANTTGGTNYGVYGKSNSATGYDFYAAGAGQNYGSSSSRRWKNNIEPIDDPLGKIAQLRGVYFEWDKAHGGHHDVGMIAEEVGKVLPEIVGYEENGIDANGMDYSKLTPLLVQAVNALRADKDRQIQEKELQIVRLEHLIADTQMRLARLERLLTPGKGTAQ